MLDLPAQMSCFSQGFARPTSHIQLSKQHNLHIRKSMSSKKKMVWPWPDRPEWVLWPYSIHIVTSALSSYHCSEINDVHIIEYSMSLVPPSKHHRQMLRYSSECEGRTWWWPWSSDGRGGPLACRSTDGINLLSFLDGSLHYYYSFCDTVSINYTQFEITTDTIVCILIA